MVLLLSKMRTDERNCQKVGRLNFLDGLCGGEVGDTPPRVVKDIAF